MCGLVGMAGNFYAKHEKMMKFMLLFDTLRGPHSTGVAAVDKDRDIDSFKMTVPGWEYIEEPRLNSLLNFQDRVWIGHNRFATVGKINRLNAHPFIIDDEDGDAAFVGAHNGTLSNRGEAIENAYSYGTDSEGLMNMIYHYGVRDAIARCQGAWALTWYDRDADTVNLLRNKDRPLFFAYVRTAEGDTKSKETIAWASEAWMLSVSAERAELYLSDIWTLEEDTLYSFRVPEKQGQPYTFKVAGGLAGKPPAPPIRHTYGGYSGGNSGGTTNRSYKPKQKYIDGGWHKLNEATGEYEPEKKEERPKTPEETVRMLRETVGNNVTQLPVIGKMNDTEASRKDSDTPTNSSSSTTTSPTSSSVPSDLKIKYKGFDGERLDPAQLDGVISQGCCWCGDKIEQSRNSPLPQEPVAWIASDLVACNRCVYDTHENELPAEEQQNPILMDAPRRDLLTVVDTAKKTTKPKKTTTTSKKQGKTTKKSGLTQKEIDDAVNGREAQEAARSVN